MLFFLDLLLMIHAQQCPCLSAFTCQSGRCVFNSTLCAGKRAQVQQCYGSPKEAANNLAEGSVDAVISTYVLDILSDQDIEDVLYLADR